MIEIYVGHKLPTLSMLRDNDVAAFVSKDRGVAVAPKTHKFIVVRTWGGDRSNDGGAEILFEDGERAKYTFDGAVGANPEVIWLGRGAIETKISWGGT